MTDEDAPLPELHQATLDDETLAQLFFDIRHAAELQAVSLKGAAEERAEETSGGDPLDRALALLRAGRVVGVQLRYAHQGRAWCDTLLRMPEGVRLVRIASP